MLAREAVREYTRMLFQAKVLNAIEGMGLKQGPEYEQSPDGAHLG